MVVVLLLSSVDVEFCSRFVLQSVNDPPERGKKGKNTLVLIGRLRKVKSSFCRLLFLLFLLFLCLVVFCELDWRVRDLLS
jgi:hypothetical protein